MYTRSLLTNKLYFNNVEILQDDTTQLFQNYLTYIQAGGIVTEVESTLEEISQEKREKAIQIDLEYTERISDLMMKHNDKFIQGILNNNPYIIPQDVLDERERLRNECNQIILELGIEDFTYRQLNLQLKTL